MTSLEQLEILDLRGSLERTSWSIGRRNGPPTSITLHYNGPPVARRTRDGEIAQLKFDAGFHIGPYLNADGLQYHFAVLSDGTIAQARDLEAILWHCGHQVGNTTSIAVHLPLGGAQDATPPQWEATTRLFDALIVRFGLAGRQSVKGHQEWKDTECPGQPLMARLRTWREQLPQPRRFQIVHDEANVREGPGVQYRIVLVMQPGEQLDADAIVTGQAIGGNAHWAHRADGVGFVHMSLLEPLPIDSGVLGVSFESGGDSTPLLRFRVADQEVAIHAGPEMQQPVVANLMPEMAVEVEQVVVGQPLGGDARWVQLENSRGFVHISALQPDS